MPTSILLYPSTDFPAAPDNINFHVAIDLLQRLKATLSPAELATVSINNLAQMRIRYTEEPTPARALQKAKTALRGAVQSNTPLTVVELQVLLDLLKEATS